MNIINVKIKRICIFAHYDRDGVVDRYVLEYIKALKPFITNLIFVSTSPLGKEDLESLKYVASQVICRQNSGYDFYSWKVGMQSLDLREADELLLVNDSCYAPLFSFEEMFAKMNSRPCDFWGVTKSYEHATHVQSYFMCFRKSVLKSEIFKRFWEEMEPIQDKHSLVKTYEVGLSQILLKSRFSMGHYFKLSPIEYLRKLFPNLLSKLPIVRNLNPYKYIRKMILSNPSLYHYENMLASGVPLLKVRLIVDNQLRIPAVNLYSVEGVNINTIDLIREHQERVGSPPHCKTWTSLNKTKS